jgi:Putative addiction module component
MEQAEAIAKAWATEIESRVQDIIGNKVEMIDGDKARIMLRARLKK